MAPYILIPVPLALLSAQVAQVVIPGFDWGAIITQWGILGAVLVWFMFRTEGLLKGNVNAIDRLARASLLLVLSLQQVNDATKQEARSILKEIDDSRTRDGKPNPPER